ncbi:transglycosylase SLT domain-containing protein [Nakamurella alba]|uniref:transglycosylase SLT domain-containing protein n=1 Tax=Nakamurella alba TaxID=2665158 RepID=UPI002AC360F2|nr:transglycosylase SLT domain-containing protein [Nakamurella alba]
MVLLLFGTTVTMAVTPAATADASTIASFRTVMTAGQKLASGRTITLASGQVSMVMSTSGELRIFAQKTLIWQTPTGGNAGAYATMRADGSFAVLAAGGTTLWSTPTAGRAGAYLSLGQNAVLAVRAAGSGYALWNSGATNSTLFRGTILQPGWMLFTKDGRVRLLMQSDGNLVIHRDGTLIWSSGTGGNPGAQAAVRVDGNLVVARAGKTLWQSATKNTTARATLQPDGYFVVYDSLQTPLWWKDKGVHARLCNTTAADPAGTTLTRWRPVIRCVLAAQGRTWLDSVTDVETIIRYESSGRPDAINLWDSNAQAGHPSKGLMQVIQPTFDRWRSTALSTDLFNPSANIFAGVNYAVNRYGSVHNVPGLVSLRAGGPYKGY